MLPIGGVASMSNTASESLVFSDEAGVCRVSSPNAVPTQNIKRMSVETNLGLEGDRRWVINSFSSTVIVVGVAFDIVLLPVAESDFEDADGLRALATKPMHFMGGNPDFITRLANAFGFANVDGGSVIENDPQLGAPSMRLKT